LLTRLIKDRDGGGVEAEGTLYSNFSKSLYTWSGAVTLITLLE